MVFEAVYHGAARLASAAFAFLLFALIARLYSPEDAKALYFFSFTLGFLIMTLRTFGAMSAGLSGAWSKPKKIRAVLGVTGHLLVLQMAAMVIAAVLFRTHPLSRYLVAVSSVTVALSSFDIDLVRAALNKRSAFSLLFACGGALAIVVLVAAPIKTVEVGSGALLAQWAPVAAVNVYAELRLIWRRSRFIHLVSSARFPVLITSLLVAVFDGVILNAPFLLGNRVGAKIGFDLSIATRIFVSSLPLAPLVLHWSNSGVLHMMSVRLEFAERRLYSSIVVLSGFAASVLLALVYIWISHKSLSWTQYLLSLVLLVAYSVYIARIRYVAPTVRRSRKLVLFSALLVAFYSTIFVVMTHPGFNASGFILLEAGALLVAAALIRTPRRPGAEPYSSTFRADDGPTCFSEPSSPSA